MKMNDKQHEKQTDSAWWTFMEVLSDEFIKQTGFGIYAYISPMDVHHIYHEFQQRQASIRSFAREYVRSYV
jgi:hypothetical protein